MTDAPVGQDGLGPRGNRTKARLRRGELVVGAHIQTASPELVELSAAVGFDFVTLDVEHEALDDHDVAHLIRAAESFGVTPIVRTSFDPDRILRYLSAGAQGIHTPHCTSAEDAKALVRACRFRPEGERTLWALGRAANYAIGTDDAEWMQRANRELLAIAMIEDIGAVERLDDILAVPGLDALHIGPKDLWQSMGLPAEDRVYEVVEDVIQRVVASGRLSISLQFRVGSAAERRMPGYVTRGVRMLTVSPLDFIRNGAPVFLDEIRHAQARAQHAG